MEQGVWSLLSLPSPPPHHPPRPPADAGLEGVSRAEDFVPPCPGAQLEKETIAKR